MTSYEESGSFPVLKINYERGIGLLNLATEQIRLFDADTANVIRKEYLEPVAFWFQQALQNPKYQNILRDRTARQRWQQYQTSADHAWNTITPSMPATPPGFGFERLGFEEATPAVTGLAEACGIAEGRHRTPTATEIGSVSVKNPWEASSPMPAVKKVASFSSSPHSGSSTQVGPENGKAYQDFGAVGSRQTVRPAQTFVTDSARDSILDNNPPLFERRRLKALPTSRSSSSVDRTMRQVEHSRVVNQSNTYWQNVMQKRSRPPTPLQTDQEIGAAIRAFAMANKQDFLEFLLPQRAASLDVPPRCNFSPYQASARDGERSQVYPAQSQLLSEQDPAHVQTVLGSDRRVADSITLRSETGEIVEPLSGPTPSTWAKIAAIAANTHPNDRENIKIQLTDKPAATLHPKAQLRHMPYEAAIRQQRVVWLAHLPSSFTCHEVSVQIAQGPIMSILLQRDVHESLPGLSACIIFQHAGDASIFLSNNGFSLADNIFVGPTLYNIPNDQNGRRVIPGSEAITPIPGCPYPMDGHLLSMGAPTFARRRIKLSRARLFYDISIRAFKRDILRVVGGATNVELFHFYNPGEATIVFTSVGVAAVALQKLRDWSSETLSEGKSLSKKDDEDARPIGHLDLTKGKYAGIDVVFVKDFNEAPTRLWSQYGRDGKLRNSSRMEGCEGVYEGPPV